MGKTPPCVEALIEAGVRRVVVAMRDPDPRVDGSGIARLRAAGVEVEVGLLEAEARRLNAGFIKRVTLGLPWVIGKWAQTLDGKTATASGDSRWISGEASRELVHRLRGRVDAVMVGAGTARADDPSLTARPADVGDVKRRAVRVVVGDPAGVPIDLRMLGDGGPEVWVRGGEGGDLRPVLRELVEQRGATHVLCEGGAGLLGSLSEQGLVDEWWVFVAPKLLGDGAARSAVAGRSVERIADAQGLVLESVERVGEDVWLRYLTGAGVAVCEPASETPGPGWQAPAR
jgi:diaminohydroxyphosphoribosylaminopyrimidine deaminase/5-amino-6-(5-phosphoribosylamino)uracil reductase